ncbi:PDR/VanB family oxidoreductase [Pseudarthrobacter sp. H2]|uniref:PDR/VanB family oxidoreductase n=1 Tax=Pseudarthrobacter sp. H2 TaxID=3418415 RepID=UPI003CF7EE6B
MTLQSADAPVLSGPAPVGKSFASLAVSELRREADNIVSVFLKAPTGGVLPPWEPGAHIDVLFGNGILRQYSLCSDPAERSYWRIAVLRELPGRGGSRYIHESLKAGDVLDIRGPQNNFRGTPGSGEKVFIAGGIGITPLLPMIRAAYQKGESWRLLYLGSSLRSMAFVEELAVLDPAGDKVCIRAREKSGRTDLTEYLRGAGLTGDATVFTCGPERMLAELRAAHTDGLVPHLLFEDFGGGPGGGPADDDAPFLVETADGTQIDVGENETILEALERAGVPALNSCRKGTCGTCETAVVAGIPDHRDEILSHEERAANETIMICVSRCRGERLVLDL